MALIRYDRINELAPLAQTEIQAGEPNGPALTELITIAYEWVGRILDSKGLFPPEGHSRDDMIQYAVSKLVLDLPKWRPDSLPYSWYGREGITCDLLEFLKGARRHKHLLLSQAASINVRVGESGNEERHDIWHLPDGSGLGRDPAVIIAQQDATETLMAELAETMSELEWISLHRCLLEGETYHAVARDLGTTPKSVDNALQRVRRKAGRLLRARRSSGAAGGLRGAEVSEGA